MLRRHWILRSQRELGALQPRELEEDPEAVLRALFARLPDEPFYFLVHRKKREYLGPLRRGEVVPAARAHYPDDPDVYIVSNSEPDSEAII